MLIHINDSLVIRILLLVFSLTLVASCTETSTLDYSLKEYRKRLNRVLDTSLPVSEVQNQYLLPSASDMLATLPAIQIEITELLSLGQCELSTLVANKNTVLGKVQLPSQQLLYELSLVKALKDCEDVIPPTSSIHAKLKTWRSAKEDQLSYRWSNFIQSSPDIRKGLSQSISTNISAEGAIRGYFYLEGLRTSIQLAHNSKVAPIEPGDLENHLYEIQKARFPANIWRSQSVITSHLTTLNQGLREYLPHVSCKDGRPSDTATILRNVFYLFFIEEVQPIAGEIASLHYKTSPVFDQWLAEPQLSHGFKAFIRQHHFHGFKTHQSVLKEHVELWQTFLARCNLSPVANG